MKKYHKNKAYILDDIDQNIIMDLQNNARQNYHLLAKKIGASEGTIRNRIKTALDNGVIQIKAVINPTKLGFEFMCIVGLTVSIDKLPIVAKELYKYPNVLFISSCTGTFDIIAILVFRNSTEFYTFFNEKIATLPGIKSTQTFVNMNLVKTPWANNVDIRKLLE